MPLIEILFWSAEGWFGWRYVLSASYRARCRERWSRALATEVFAERTALVLGWLASLAVAGALAATMTFA